MTGTFKKTVAAGALSLAAAAPAAADYTILKDDSMPSVVFIEFEGDAVAPTVISVTGEESAAVSDPALPAVVNGGEEGAAAPTSSGTSAPMSQSSSNRSVEDRVNEKIAELEKSTNDVENDIIDQEVDDKVLKELELR